MKTLKAATIVVLLAAACSNQSKKPSLAESDPPLDKYNYLQERDFYGLVRRVVYNFEPSRSAAELAQFSDVVVLGQIVSIADGRSFLGGPSDPNSMKTVVARIAVEDVIRGNVGSDVYVAFWRSDVTPLETFQSTIPNDRMLVFLDAVQAQVDTHDPLKGVPDGQVLYEVVNPQGIAVPLDDGHIVQPLTEQELWLFREDHSLADVVARLKLVGPEPPYQAPLTPAQIERNLACREEGRAAGAPAGSPQSSSDSACSSRF